jgi:hypothetical protein
MALSGCASHVAPPILPINIGGGLPGQYGEYASMPAGEMQNASGQHCMLFNWDRPLPNGVIRVTSASCPSQTHPGMFVASQIARSYIPLSQSNLKDEAAAAAK